MQEKRLGLNVGLEEVSEATGISPGVILALEDEDRERLPAEVYIKAFYKKYAEYLNLDPDEIQAQYEQQSGSLKKGGNKHSFSTVITLKDKEENLFVEIVRRLLLPLAIILLGILLYWLYKNYLSTHNPFALMQGSHSLICSIQPSGFTGFLC